MSERGSFADRVESLLCVETEEGCGGYRGELLREQLPAFMKRLVTCSRCEGLMRGATGVGSPQLFVCSVCVTGETHSALGLNREAVANLVILCPLRSRGCEWEGRISASETHLDTCQYLSLECPMLCGRVFRRADIESHVSVECPLREIKCEHCSQSLVQIEMCLHMSECPMLPVSCSSGCGDTVRRGDMESHGETCPNSLLSCRYLLFGCDLQVMRRDMETHLSEYRLQHMEMLTHSGMQDLRKELDRVNEENTHLSEELNATKQELSAFQAAMESVVGETRDLKRGLKELTLLSAGLKQEMKTLADNKASAVPEETQFPASPPGKLAFSVDRLSQLTNEKRAVFVYTHSGTPGPSPGLTKLTVLCKVVGLVSKLQLSCQLILSSPRVCQLDTSTLLLHGTLNTPYLVYRSSSNVLPLLTPRASGYFISQRGEETHSCLLAEVPLDLLMEPGICVQDSVSVQLFYKFQNSV